MKRVFMPKPGEVLVDSAPEPEVQNEDVLIRVKNVGLCGSDLHSFRGRSALTKYPLVPGHEIGGEAVAFGGAVPKGLFKAGAHVTVRPYFNCGHCYPCSLGRINCCENSRTLGVQLQNGALCEYIAVPYTNVIDCGDMSFKDMALIEPLSVGMHLANRTGIRERENVVVFGCGVIGLGAIAAAYFKDANVIAVDIADEKFQTAKKMGARHCINAKKNDLDRALTEIVGDQKVHAALEAIGFGGTMAKAAEIAAFAGRIGYVGYGSGELRLDSNMIVQKELGIFGSRNALHSEFISVMENIRSNRLPFDALLSAVFPVEEAPRAFAEWDRDTDRFIKIQISFD